MTKVFPDEPDFVIKAPINFENNHKLSECPICHLPDPVITFVLPIEGKSATTYDCKNGHGFSAHQNLFKDADLIKIFKIEKPEIFNYICNNCYAVHVVEVKSCRSCKKVGMIRKEKRMIS